jgi:phospholipid/cholesterol/gamma-HCH transport system substrate-binding protein
MNNPQQAARVGLFFILGIALTWVTFVTLSGGTLFKKKGYDLVAGFDDLKQLKVGDDVRMSGVKIGAVDQMRLGAAGAEAVLKIEPGYSVPGDAVATIAMGGLLGTNYIGIDRAGAVLPALADGARIRTAVTPDINGIMTELGSLGKRLEGALSSIDTVLNGADRKEGGLFQKLDRLVGENSPRVGATIANLQSISGKIDRGEGTLGKLVNDSELHDQLLASARDLKATAAQATSLMADAREAVDRMKSGQGTLGVLLYDPKAADNLRVTMQNMRDISAKLSSGQGTLGRLISDDSLYFSARDTIHKADRALDGMSDSGPITAVGIVANSLF